MMAFQAKASFLAGREFCLLKH